MNGKTLNFNLAHMFSVNYIQHANLIKDNIDLRIVDVYLLFVLHMVFSTRVTYLGYVISEISASTKQLIPWSGTQNPQLVIPTDTMVENLGQIESPYGGTYR